jgi:6-phosphofructokinase 1
MKIAILTGGGDCPGLNAVIRAVVRKGVGFGYEITGIKNGWKGMLERDTIALGINQVSGILPRGGTILGTSRTNPEKIPDGFKKIAANMASLGIDVLIAVGGDDTLGVANKLSKMGLKTIGVPKTIDNDLSATDYTFGFDTAINIVMEAIDRLHTTAESHHRVMVVEVMGRHAGWIATFSGMAGGADEILIPEVPFSLNELCENIKKRHARGKDFSIVVVAEGAKPKEEKEFITQDKKLDAFGHVRLGGIGERIGSAIEEMTGYETRVTVLGHIQRGGSPTAFDRILGTRFGVKAVELVREGKFGYMVSLQGNKIVAVPLENAVAKLKTIDMDLYNVAKTFFG